MLYRNYPKLILFLLLLTMACAVKKEAVREPLTFGVVTDTHIGKNTNSEALNAIVTDINLKEDLEFVLHAGDISDFGYDHALTEAKQLMEGLDIPYFIVPGNHDTGWSASGGLVYNKLWKEQKFAKDIGGIRFIGFSTGPFGRMSRGYVPLDQMRWLDSLAQATPKEQRVVYLTHYPLDKGMSNYEDLIQIMHNTNTVAVLVGHGHQNKLLDFGGIPGLMTRTAQERKGTLAYNLFELGQDSLKVKAVEVGKPVPGEYWAALDLTREKTIGKKYFEENRKTIPGAYSKVEVLWSYQDKANILSTPVLWDDRVIFGNLLGDIKALNLKTGKPEWTLHTGGPIYSSPEIAGEQVYVASSDSLVYSIDLPDGEIQWRFKADAPVLGSPAIEGEVLYIGSSDSTFRALDLGTGKELWAFDGIEGFPASKAAIGEDKVIFGSWGKTLYALDKSDGSLAWKWKNEKRSRYYSPAMVVPVIQNGKVYVVAPDEILRGFDLETGENDFLDDRFRVRESLGGNAEGNILVAKTMQDSVVAWNTGNGKPELLMNISAGFGNDFSASMPAFDKDTVFFGTTFGRVYAVNVTDKKVLWAYQLGEDMVNTVRALGNGKVLASSVDGKIAILGPAARPGPETIE